MKTRNSASPNTEPDQCNNNPSCTVGEMLTIGESLFSDSEVYCGHGTDCAWDEAVCLLSFVVGLPPNADKSVLDKKLSESQVIEVKSLSKNV